MNWLKKIKTPFTKRGCSTCTDSPEYKEYIRRIEAVRKIKNGEKKRDK